MLTRIAPIRAVANWVSTHSGTFGAQMPTRSPLAIPWASSPLASASTSAANSVYVHRRPLGTSTSASRPPNRATVAARFSPIVWPSSGSTASPFA